MINNHWMNCSNSKCELTNVNEVIKKDHLTGVKL